MRTSTISAAMSATTERATSRTRNSTSNNPISNSGRTRSSADGPLKSFLTQAKKNLLPVRDRVVFIKDGQEFLPGITAIGAPGHTVGHTIFNISSAGKSMAYIGDLTHHPVLLMEKPLTEFAYDTDPKQSAQTRVRLLNMLASNKTPIVSYHFAWPGLGHVGKQGDGFRYFPSPMQMVL